MSFTPGDRVMEGRKAALTCESDANPPVVHYTWFDWNNQDLQYNGRTLRLEPLQIEHSGSYRCQVSNRLGTGESPPSTLTVYCKSLSSSQMHSCPGCSFSDAQRWACWTTAPTSLSCPQLWRALPFLPLCWYPCLNVSFLYVGFPLRLRPLSRHPSALFFIFIFKRLLF